MGCFVRGQSYLNESARAITSPCQPRPGASIQPQRPREGLDCCGRDLQVVVLETRSIQETSTTKERN